MTAEIEIVRIPVTAARASELVQAIDQARTGYLAAPACQDLKLLLNQARDEVAVIVTWSSAQAHAEASKTPQAASFFKVISNLARGTPDVRAYLSAVAKGE